MIPSKNFSLTQIYERINNKNREKKIWKKRSIIKPYKIWDGILHDFTVPFKFTQLHIFS